MIMDIVHCQFEHLSDSHTTPGHQFQHQAVAGLCGAKNNLIDGLFFDDVPVGDFRGFKQLFHHRNSTGVFKALIQVGFNKVEK